MVEKDHAYQMISVVSEKNTDQPLPEPANVSKRKRGLDNNISADKDDYNDLKEDDNTKLSKSTETIVPKKKVKLVQMHFQSSKKEKICPKCQMSFLPHVQEDVKIHQKFHSHTTEGIPTALKFAKLVKENIPLNYKGTRIKCSVVEINITRSREVSIAKAFLKIVNTSLNAPKETSLWEKGKGKVFMIIAINKVVGIVSTEECSIGNWLIYETGNLVPKQEFPVQIGISRIFVSSEFRRNGLGILLLNIVKDHSIYGMSLKKTQIAWSQPSEFGGRLAMKFNAVEHKSGKHLIPVYTECASE